MSTDERIQKSMKIMLTENHVNRMLTEDQKSEVTENLLQIIFSMKTNIYS